MIGRRILLDGRPREIIGVLPERFRFLDRKPSFVLPIRLDRGKTRLGQFNYTAVARLKEGTSVAQASADVARMIPMALQRFPASEGFTVKMFEDAHITPLVRPLKASVTGDIGSVLWVLMGTVGVVLLIACANVANLLLVRAEGRQQELAVRAALGADRGTLTRELLVESVMLSGLGGLLGLGLSFAALRLLQSMAPANLPRLDEIGIDGSVLLFTVVVSLAAGLLFGAIPAFKHAGPHLGTALRAGGRSLSQSKERHGREAPWSSSRLRWRSCSWSARG